MKSFNSFLALIFLATVAVSCKNAGPETTPEITNSEETAAQEVSMENSANAKAEFTIEGMTCPMGCAKRIENKLAASEGVTSASVDFDKKLAMVEYDKSKLSTGSLEEIVKSVGDSYSVSEMKTLESFTGHEAKHNCSEDGAKEGCSSEKKKACGSSCSKPCGAKKA